MAERLASAEAAAVASRANSEGSVGLEAGEGPPSFPDPTLGCSTPADRANAPITGSRAWAIAIAMAVWVSLNLVIVLVVAAYFIVAGYFIGAGGGSEEESLALLERDGIVTILGILMIAALAPSIVIGVRAERLHGWRTWLVVAGCLVALMVVMTVTGLLLPGIGYLIVFFVLWTRRRHSPAPNRP